MLEQLELARAKAAQRERDDPNGSAMEASKLAREADQLRLARLGIMRRAMECEA